MSMRELEETLPSDIFMRVHRSFIVNLRRIEIVERNRIVFGKTYIPISESKRANFSTAYVTNQIHHAHNMHTITIYHAHKYTVHNVKT